jgi:hypothetical protein
MRQELSTVAWFKTLENLNSECLVLKCVVITKSSNSVVKAWTHVLLTFSLNWGRDDCILLP